MLGGFGAYRSRLVQGCSAYCTNRVRVGVGCPTHRTPHLRAAANVGSILQRAWLRQHPVTRTPGPDASTVQRCYSENWAECGSMAHLHSQKIVDKCHTHTHSGQSVAQRHTHTHSRQTVTQWSTHTHRKLWINGTPTLTANCGSMAHPYSQRTICGSTAHPHSQRTICGSMAHPLTAEKTVAQWHTHSSRQNVALTPCPYSQKAKCVFHGAPVPSKGKWCPSRRTCTQEGLST